MPTVEFDLHDLSELVGKKIDVKELKDKGILFVKGEVEEFDGNRLKVDIKDTNRPDLWSVEGIARNLKGYYGVETGIPKYRVRDSSVKIRVNKNVKAIRPYVVGAVVKGVNLSDEAIKQLVQLQEKVTQTFGRNRAEVAIGVYDFSKISNEIEYKAVAPNGVKFVPLGFSKPMTPEEILEKHPKGIEYGHLIKGFGMYPLLVDSKGNVLSMPPIINSELTGKVDESTREVFIDVTGNNVEKMMVSLNIMATALADRGGKIYSVEIIDGNKSLVVPDIKPRRFSLNAESFKNVAGFDVEKEEMVALLEKYRYGAKIVDGKIHVSYLPYRNDIMDERDVIEDILIAYGYDKIIPEEPSIATIGRESNRRAYINIIRDAFIGLGMQEVITFVLSSKRVQKLFFSEDELVEVENPVSSEYAVMRRGVLPSLLEFLRKNKKARYPQMVFEVGDCVAPDESKDEMTASVKKAACAIVSNDASFTKMKSFMEHIALCLGVKFEYRKSSCPGFRKGRSADVYLKNNFVGTLGEVDPKVISFFEIEKNCCAAEIDVDTVIKTMG